MQFPIMFLLLASTVLHEIPIKLHLKLTITVDIDFSDNAGDIDFGAKLSLYPIYHYVHYQYK